MCSSNKKKKSDISNKWLCWDIIKVSEDWVPVLTWLGSFSPPSVSRLKLTLDPEWCLVRVGAGWQARRCWNVSDERAVSCDVSLGSGPSPIWVDGSAGRQSRASASWAWTAVNSSQYCASGEEFYSNRPNTVTKLTITKTSWEHTHTHLIPVIVRLHAAVGADGEVVSEIVLAVVRRLHPSAKEQHRLWAGVGPRQDTLLIHTAQHLHTHTHTHTIYNLHT